MCWHYASDATSYPIREQDELLVQGYEKRGNKCLFQQSEDVQLLERTYQSTRHHEIERRSHLPVLECVVTQILDNH